MLKAKKMYFSITTSVVFLLPLIAHGQAAPTIQQVAPPQGIVSTAQPWLTHQEWFCIPKGTYSPGSFATGMNTKINSIAQGGWELVAFNQVSIADNSCFVATFKAPKKQ